MSELIASIAIVALVAGVALGWYLRRVTVWCPHCGDALACTSCGGRPTWSSPGQTRRRVP